MKKTILLLTCLLLSVAVWAQKTKVVIHTEYGKIVMMLYDKTPKHRDNMIKLIKEKFYDGTLFHRVIPGFVIQGGDPDSKDPQKSQPGAPLGEGDVGYRIPAEINDEYFHQRGAVGMARDNNPDKSSSGCQFYIVTGKKFTDADLEKAEQRSGHKIPPAHREVYKTVGGVPHLDGGYTVFGIVTEGMDVVEKIANEPRNAADRPNKDIKMISVRIVKKKRFLFF
jgi:peptidyl-prolyl cis-trans isomerase B (cyclophilin B)